MELLTLFQNAKKASLQIGIQDTKSKNEVLKHISIALVQNINQIIFENKKDLDLMSDDDPKKDRLLLNEARIQGIAESILKVVALEDPAGRIEIDKKLDNQLHLQKIYVPMGVVGVIFESRPNVTIDVSVLNIK